MAVGWIPLEAHHRRRQPLAERAAHQRHERLLNLWIGREMIAVALQHFRQIRGDAPQRLRIAGELRVMIADALLREAFHERGLREARLVAPGDVAHVQQEADAVPLQQRDEFVEAALLVADGKDQRGFIRHRPGPGCA